MNGIQSLALSHGGIYIGLTLFVCWRYLRHRSRLPMLLIAVATMLQTVFSVRAVFHWGRWDSPWFMLLVVSWLIADAALMLYLIVGPPVHHKNGRST